MVLMFCVRGHGRIQQSRSALLDEFGGRIQPLQWVHHGVSCKVVADSILGSSIIRVGVWGPLGYHCNKEPPK